jgi:hypothetical protein
MLMEKSVMVIGREFILSQWGLRALAGSLILLLLLSRVCFSFSLDFTNLTVGFGIFAGEAGVSEGAWAPRVDERRLVAFNVFRERSEGASDDIITHLHFTKRGGFGASFGVTGAAEGQGREVCASGERSERASDDIITHLHFTKRGGFGASFGVTGAAEGQGREVCASGERSERASDDIITHLHFTKRGGFGASFGVVVGHGSQWMREQRGELEMMMVVLLSISVVL